MADHETTLRRLSERGKPVGAEELIERVKAEMAGDPLVVVPKRREGRLMTKTSQPPMTERRNRPRGPLLGLAAFAIVIALGAVYYFTSRDNGATEVASPTTDLDIIEAGVAAVYTGDENRAVELFELDTDSYGNPVMTDEQVRDMARYQKAIGGRLAVNCEAKEAPGEFSCRLPYQNVMTEAVSYSDRGDTIAVVVKNGVITTFGFPEHSQMLVSMTAYLAREVGDAVPAECRHWYSPFSDNCVTLQLDHLDDWAVFYKEVWPEHEDALTDEIVELFASSVCVGGTIAECDAAHYEAITNWAESQK